MSRQIEGRFTNWMFNSFSVTPEGLGLYRIFVALLTFCFLLPSTQMYTFLGSLPSAFFAPPPGPMWLLSGFPPEGFFYLLHGVLIVSLLLMLVGFKTFTASIVTGITLLIIKGFFYSVGKINHDLLLVVVPILMAFSNWGKAYSLDSFLTRKGDEEFNIQSWPLTLLAMIIGFMMFTAGFPKILGGWLDPNTQATLGHFIKQYFANNRHDLLADQAFLIDSRIIWELLDYGTIFFEAGFLLAIVHPKTTRLFVCIAVLFHFSVMSIMNISFLHNFVAYAAFLSWTNIDHAINKWTTAKWSPIMGVVGFFVLFQGIIVIGTKYNIPELHSDLNVYEFYALLVALPVALGYILKQNYILIKYISRSLRRK